MNMGSADSIKRGLMEAIEHAEGRTPQTRIHRPRPVDVKALRAKVSMTAAGQQPQICSANPCTSGGIAQVWCTQEKSLLSFE